MPLSILASVTISEGRAVVRELQRNVADADNAAAATASAAEGEAEKRVSWAEIKPCHGRQTVSILSVCIIQKPTSHHHPQTG